MVRALGRRAVVLHADLRDPDACERVVDETVDALGRLDVLVNMASVYRPRSFDDMTPEDWNAAMEVDLRASWLCTRAAVPHMRRLRGGRIINFSDWVARSGRPRYPGYLPYYVAKAAVIGLTEALALELAPRSQLRSHRTPPWRWSWRRTRSSSTRSHQGRSSRPKGHRTRSSPPSSGRLRSVVGAARWRLPRRFLRSWTAIS